MTPTIAVCMLASCVTVRCASLGGRTCVNHFILQPPPWSPYALQFLTAVSASHLGTLIFLLQLVAGILLPIDRFVPLAPVVQAAVLTKILDFHVTLDPGGIVPGLIATALWFVVAQRYRDDLRGLFSQKGKAAEIA